MNQIYCLFLFLTTGVISSLSNSGGKKQCKKHRLRKWVIFSIKLSQANLSNLECTPSWPMPLLRSLIRSLSVTEDIHKLKYGILFQ